jgi:hypothetical protein
MPPQKKRRKSDQTLGFYMSFKQLGAIGTLVAILGGGVGAVNKLAFKTDLNPLWDAEKDHESRIRELERAMDRFFGQKTPAVVPVPAPAPFTLRPVQWKMAAKMEAQMPSRIVVVPKWFVDQYHLHPAASVGYKVLGEDGQLYSVDQVLAVMIEAEHVHK